MSANNPNKNQTDSDVRFVTDHRGVLHVVDLQRGDLMPDEQERQDRIKDAELDAYYG